MFGSKLQGIDHTKHLMKIPARRSRIGDDQFDGFIGTNNKKRSDGGSSGCIGMDHVIQGCHFPALICNNGEINGAMLRFIDILHPAFVFVQWINTNGQHLYIAAGELLFQKSGSSQFGCTNRCVIGGV